MAMRLKSYSSAENVAIAAADYICEAAHKAVRDNGYFTLALSGGRTPNLLYKLLATAPYATTLPWDQMFFFWGDERYVAPTDAESNYGAVMTHLFSRVPIPARNVHPMLTMAPDSVVAARLYEQTVRQVFDTIGSQGFDVALLGLGTDGHTASLFPESRALQEQERWVISTSSTNGQTRLTLTLPLINLSSAVVFLVTGAEKREVLASILETKPSVSQLPAALVKGKDLTLWLVDYEAWPKTTC